MTLLPEKFGGAKEESRAHLPPNHICPLVDLDGQVPVGADPAREGIGDHGLRCGSDDQRVLEFAGGSPISAASMTS